jgi:hypothetical protein
MVSVHDVSEVEAVPAKLTEPKTAADLDAEMAFVVYRTWLWTSGLYCQQWPCCCCLSNFDLLIFLCLLYIVFLLHCPFPNPVVIIHPQFHDWTQTDVTHAVIGGLIALTVTWRHSRLSHDRLLCRHVTVSAISPPMTALRVSHLCDMCDICLLVSHVSHRCDMCHTDVTHVTQMWHGSVYYSTVLFNSIRHRALRVTRLTKLWFRHILELTVTREFFWLFS